MAVNREQSCTDAETVAIILAAFYNELCKLTDMPDSTAHRLVEIYAMKVIGK